MAVPTFDRFIEPLLRYLAQHPEGVQTRQAYEAVAEMVGLSEEDKRERVPSGAMLTYKNRISWAFDRLKRAGLAQNPRRGLWKITEEGIRYT